MVYKSIFTIFTSATVSGDGWIDLYDSVARSWDCVMRRRRMKSQVECSLSLSFPIKRSNGAPNTQSLEYCSVIATRAHPAVLKEWYIVLQSIQQLYVGNPQGARSPPSLSKKQASIIPASFQGYPYMNFILLKCFIIPKYCRFNNEHSTA